MSWLFFSFAIENKIKTFLIEIFIVKTNHCEYMKASTLVLSSVSDLLGEYTVSGIEAWKPP